MQEYLLELYVSQSNGTFIESGRESARSAAAELSRRGTHVRLSRSIFVPTEETWFVVFEAESADAVRDVARLANLPAGHVSKAFTHDEHPRRRR